MDFFTYRTMDSFVYQIIGHWIIIGTKTIFEHWTVLDKRTTHASGTPPFSINTYYANDIINTFEYAIIDIFAYSIVYIFEYKYRQEQPQDQYRT